MRHKFALCDRERTTGEQTPLSTWTSLPRAAGKFKQLDLPRPAAQIQSCEGNWKMKAAEAGSILPEDLLRREAKELLKFGNREAGQLGKLRDFFFESHFAEQGERFRRDLLLRLGLGLSVYLNRRRSRRNQYEEKEDGKANGKRR